MNYVQKLPYIFSAVAAIIIYSICLKRGISSDETYIKMALGMSVFMLLGFYIRRSLVSIMEDVKWKKALEETEQERQRVEAAKQKAVEQEMAKHPSTIDYRVEDDDFSPLTVSDYIKTKK